MTIAEYPPQSPPAAEPPPDRTPPQDVAAEQSVLGAMLLSKDAVADVVEVIRQADFYRPAHQAIFGAVTDLFTKGEPADAITVAAALMENGELTRVGGPAYLHTLVASVPTAANASYYAGIVRDTAIRRRLVEAGTRIAQVAYAGEGEVDMMVDRAQAEVFDVTSLRTSEDYLPLAEIMDGAVAEIEGIASRGGEMVGVPTGFIDLDRLTNGLHAGQLVIVAARPAIGKALALDTPIPTPSGWSTMADLQVGQHVLGPDGRPTQIVAATDVMVDRRCHRVEFSDGTGMVADADHQWQVHLPGSPDPQIRTTAELLAGMSDRDHTTLPRLPQVAAMRLPATDLPLDPYALGVWLAATDRRTPVADPEILMWLEGMNLTPATLGQWAQEAGITPGGFVPPAYLRAAEGQRRSLLAGLLDVAGDVDAAGAVVIDTGSRPLAQGLYELLGTLGISAALASGPPHGSRATVRVTFTCDEAVFRLHHKDSRHKELWATYAIGPAQQRFLTAITPVPTVPVRCIEVDNDSHLYLAGRGMVPTHNSTLGLDIARSASVKHGLASVIFSLEMSRNEIVMRLLSAEAQVPLSNMRSGKMHDPEWRKIATRQGVLHEAPLFVDDSPNMTMTEIRAKCRRLKQRHDLRLVIVDYMQLMTSGKKVESRQQEVSEFSRSLKLLAKELNVPVIAISQLNRGPETRNDKKPMLSDLRESGCLTAATRVLRADTGAEVTLGELVASGARDVPVWSLDDSLRYRRSTLTHVFATGHREVFRITTASGRAVEATANHPLLTHDGWRPAGELTAGTRIGVPRHVPAPRDVRCLNSDELIVMAHLVGSGSLLSHGPLTYRSGCPLNLETVAEAVVRRFGVLAGRAEEGVLNLSPAWGKTDVVREWCEGMLPPGRGLAVPEQVFAAPKDQVALFLRHLWATEGRISQHPAGTVGVVYFRTTSRRLADDVARLLLRFGVTARVTTQGSPDRPVYCTAITDPADQKVFLRRIGGTGALSRPALDLLRSLQARQPGPAAPPPSPEEDRDGDLWQEVRRVLAEAELSDDERVAQRAAIALDERITHPEMDDQIVLPESPARHLQRVATVLDSGDLELVATNDLLWDEVVDLEYIGTQDVYDATVLGGHNFIADGVAVHNSLEQDADMVVLIHREDAYDKDSSRIGEADLIVAKHRNGPTDTITVAFQGHYSRFVDMARE